LEVDAALLIEEFFLLVLGDLGVVIGVHRLLLGGYFMKEFCH